MNGIRKDVRDLITLNERLQSALTRGEAFTDDEIQLIRTCADELLRTLPAQDENSWMQDSNANADRMTGSWHDHADTSQTDSSPSERHD